MLVLALPLCGDDFEASVARMEELRRERAEAVRVNRSDPPSPSSPFALSTTLGAAADQVSSMPAWMIKT